MDTSSSKRIVYASVVDYQHCLLQTSNRLFEGLLREHLRAKHVSILDLLPEEKKGGLPDYLMSAKAMIVGAWILFPVVSREQSVICPKCRTQVLSSSNYCNFCGARLRQPYLLKICSKCWSRMEATSKFCPECGQKQPRIPPALATVIA